MLEDLFPSFPPDIVNLQKMHNSERFSKNAACNPIVYGGRGGGGGVQTDNYGIAVNFLFIRSYNIS